MRKEAVLKIITIVVFGVCIIFIAAMFFSSVLYAIEIFKNAEKGIAQIVL
jgi:hypothetical protein